MDLAIDGWIRLAFEQRPPPSVLRAWRMCSDQDQPRVGLPAGRFERIKHQRAAAFVPSAGFVADDQRRVGPQSERLFCVRRRHAHPRTRRDMRDGDALPRVEPAVVVAGEDRPEKLETDPSAVP